MHFKSPWATAVVGTLSVAGIYLLYESVTQYGWEGTVNYVRFLKFEKLQFCSDSIYSNCSHCVLYFSLSQIWLGDPFPQSPILEYLKLATDIESSLDSEENRLTEIENALQRAKAEIASGDKHISRSLVLLWTINYPGLELALGEISHNLDSAAAHVDSILLAKVNFNARAVQDLRSKRKELSRKAVECMGRCDALMVSFKVTLDEE